jgi:NADPH:quinone reductase-like Zn-dependent oxidoreductase
MTRGQQKVSDSLPGKPRLSQSLGRHADDVRSGTGRTCAGTRPAGVDVALDVAGRGALPELIELTGSPERVLTSQNPQAQQYGVPYTGGGGQRSYEALDEAARLFTQGRFSLPVARTFPVADAPEAHLISEAGHVRGKLVLLVD